MIPRICIIAGSDSGGGAGVQADIKTVTMLKGYAATAITALTAQDTRGVHDVLPVPKAFIAKQISLILEDIGADAIKTGMLHDHEVIEAVVETLTPYPTIPLVLDPVMVAKGGAPLLEESAISFLKDALIPRATLLTPNIPEASLLTGIEIHDLSAMKKAAALLLKLGANAVLLKGGHLEGDTLYDVLLTGKEEHVFTSTRIHTRHTHGTGCTLASAISCLIGHGKPLHEAVKEARDYVQGAMLHAPGFGKGHGPLHHGWIL